ncbi:MAG: GNAT family N-acetyltransferase [Christensenellaceae bacterium]|nr:GNAT family N-acetyltransferase [Christensenellaceae bacterium]
MRFVNTGLSFENINAFYDMLIEHLDDAKYSPGWKKGIYPDEEMIREAIDTECMHAAMDGDTILAVAMLDSNYNDEYKNVEWKSGFKLDECLMLHVLGVNPAYQKHGIGSKMLKHLENHAKKLGYKAIRLDVLRGNLPAERLYPSIGYDFIDTIEIYYADTGLTYYHLYEKVL